MLKTLSVHCFARKASTKSQIEAQSIFLENFCRTKGADGIALKILGGEGVEKCSSDFIPCQHVSISVEKNAHWIPGLIPGQCFPQNRMGWRTCLNGSGWFVITWYLMRVCVYVCMCVIHTLCMRPFPPIISWWWQTSPLKEFRIKNTGLNRVKEEKCASRNDGGTISHPVCPLPYWEPLGLLCQLPSNWHTALTKLASSSHAMTDIEVIWIRSSGTMGFLAGPFFWQIVIRLDNDSPPLLSTGLYCISTNKFRIPPTLL